MQLLGPNPSDLAYKVYEAALRREDRQIIALLRHRKGVFQKGLDDLSVAYVLEALNMLARDGAFGGMKILLEAGTPVAGPAGLPALRLCAMLENPRGVRMLLSSGVAADYPPGSLPEHESKLTPLMVACVMPRPENVGLLLAAGASPWAKNEDGLTALDLLEQNLSNVSAETRDKAGACAKMLVKEMFSPAAWKNKPLAEAQSLWQKLPAVWRPYADIGELTRHLRAPKPQPFLPRPAAPGMSGKP